MTNTATPPRVIPPVPTSISEQAQQVLAAIPYRTPEPHPPLDDIKAWERHIAIGDQVLLQLFAAPDEAVAVEERRIADVPTFIIRPERTEETPEAPIYLDIHGGALIMGGGPACRAMCTRMAITTGMLTCGVDYRMPPRHPYPAALDDCIAVYRQLLQERDPGQIIVGGGSAGGNLAAALLLRAHQEGLPMPAGLVLLTPELDLTESGDSFHTNLGIDNVLTSSLMATNLLYAGGHDLSDPWLSPLFGDVTAFPPTFLQAGTRDLFLSNAVRMHRKLRAAGIDAELHIFEAMPHGGFGGDTPEDHELGAKLRRFICRFHRA